MREKEKKREMNDLAIVSVALVVTLPESSVRNERPSRCLSLSLATFMCLPEMVYLDSWRVSIHGDDEKEFVICGERCSTVETFQRAGLSVERKETL